MPRKKVAVIFVVSDGRGGTAEQLVTAAAVQFEGRYRIVRESGVRTSKRIVGIVKKAAKANGAIFYTLVSADTRQTMKQECGKLLVPGVDILGPAFTVLHELFHSEPGATPGLLYSLEQERFDRMDAIDYTLKHDDGRRPDELHHAQLVVVGVSRASKSSTCFYLAYNGVKAANVPLLPDIPPPPELLALPAGRVIGLRVSVDRLLTVRGARAQHLRIRESDPYLDRRAVAREVNDAHRTMEKHGWRSLDASYLAVEEIAREVMQLVHTPETDSVE